jgi:hypothetical protein
MGWSIIRFFVNALQFASEEERVTTPLQPMAVRDHQPSWQDARRYRMMDLVTILEEPRAETYVALLQFALRHNSLFSLVWREQLEFANSAHAIAETLRPTLVRTRRTDQWPGTQLVGHFATVRLYRMSRAALPTLVSTEGLYAWLAPHRPEDLAFYLSEDIPWLGSIAHEQDAFIYSQAVDLHELSARVQGLKLERVTGRRPG